MPYQKVSFLIALFFVSLGWGQFTIPEKPQKQTSIYDYVNLLSAPQSKALEQKLIRYSDSTSTQIVIVIINSTEGENINFLGAQWGQKWGIGQADKDNGILVLLARNDRRIAINTGYGAEGSLTDFMSKRIIESVIIPEFKKGDYYGGLDKGSDAIFQVLNGEFKEDRTFGNDQGFSLKSLLPFIIFLIILIILSRKGRNNRNNKGGRGGKNKGMDIWDMIILSNMGRGGYRGSSSGGGFGSGGFGGGFGGGGFGGGGASGGW